MSHTPDRANDISHLTSGMRNEDATALKTEMTRRGLLRGGAAAGAGLAALGIFGGIGATPVPGQSAGGFLSAQDMPEGAAAAELQVYRVPSDPANSKSLDFYEQVYGRPLVADLFSEPLVRINRNFEIEPAAATEWSSNDDGTVWTFKLDQGLMWSDDTPVTAADWVKTFQYAADPEHAWDFTWFWAGDLVNFSEAIAGDVPVDEIGVRQGADEFELVFETVNAAPYLPSKLLYSLPLSKKALEESGPLYNTNPDTAVSSGPFIIDEWLRDQSLTYKRNEKYTGSMEVPIQKVIVKFAAPNTWFTLYEADQVDYIEGPAPAELQIMEADDEKAAQIYQGVGDFGCFYFFFDVDSAPFDDLKVRQAFSHVLDREAMKQQIWGRQANAAPSFLAPGFPGSNTEALADIQKFDPDLAKQLLEEAGFPNGEGFPSLTLEVRGGGSPVEIATTQAYGSMLKQHLNINVEIQNVDREAFYDALNAKPTQVLFGWISYGMDYFDPSNMLGVWASGGRHSWSNEDYDAKVKEAAVFLGDTDERIAMFQEAERILVEDVPAVFAYFSTPIQLIKPYMAGPALDADDNGITAVHWPGFTTMSTVPGELFVGEDAPEGRS
ncbi:MAG TPA: peptide ABC transporter substrate-binding protein [Thermomicrobiales bacterium]|nr:peptide ABC transporter substrate-binding protein [Thermomicrobiales bacterium]